MEKEMIRKCIDVLDQGIEFADTKYLKNKMAFVRMQLKKDLEAN